MIIVWLILIISLLSPQAFATPEADCKSFSSVNLTLIMHKSVDRPVVDDSINETHRFGDFSNVIAACKRASEAQPSDPALTLQYARALIADTDVERAKVALRPLVDVHQPTAIRLYGALTYGVLGGAADPRAAIPFYKLAAELGDPVAPLLYARWLQDTDRPEEEYKPWYIRAAQTGYAPAEFILYSWSVQGMIHGVTKTEQLRLLQDSARKGFPYAMMRLAKLLRDGSLPPDPARADALEATVRKIQPEAGLGFQVYYWEFG